MSEPLAVVRYVVDDPVGKNRMYGTSRFGSRYLTASGRDFKERVRNAALVAFTSCSTWPRDPWVPAEVRISLQIYNVRHDTDAMRVVARDAGEGVLYANDRVCSDGPSPLAVKDGNGRRIEIVAELIAVRTDAEARKMREQYEKRKVARVLAKAKAPKKAAAPKRVRKPKWV